MLISLCTIFLSDILLQTEVFSNFNYSDLNKAFSQRSSQSIPTIEISISYGAQAYEMQKMNGFGISLLCGRFDLARTCISL